MKRKVWMKKVWIFCMLVLGVCTVFSTKANAAGTYQITETENGLTGTYNDKVLQNVYVPVKKNDHIYQVAAPCAKNSKVYYFDENGVGTPFTGSKFIRVSYRGSAKTYYSNKGTLEQNKIVGNKKAGYFYVDSTGVKVTDKTVKLAVKFVRAHTKSSDSQSQKLSKCYYYLARHYKYKRSYGNLYPKAKDMKSFAHGMLSSKSGNCHAYAASFVYIARVLGYDARVVVGDVSSSHGGMTPHGWVEVKQNGKWYVCDPDMEENNKVKCYMKTETPCKTSVKRRCTITVKNGKVSWK
ncbi:MAG: transglutaminase-like domain-containing protein [Clostridium sp.]|nr:transglutaminase-like domain-containing protein [Clostridium sp.]